MLALFRSTVAVGLALIAAPAAADDGWSGHLWLEAQPTIKWTDTSGNTDRSDGSHHEFAAWATSPDVLPDEPVLFKVGGIAEPHVFDDQTGTSSLYGQVQLGNRLLYPDRLNAEIFSGNLHPKKRVNYFASLTHLQNYDGFLHSRAGHADVAQVGVEYADLESMWCTRGDRTVPAEDSKNACQGGAAKAGLSYSLDANASRTWASDPAKDEDNFEFIGRVEGPPVADLFRPIAAINLDRTLYDSAVTPSGDTRHDTTVSLFGGLDLAPIVKVPHLLTHVGVERAWQDSNDPAHDETDTRLWLRMTFLVNL